MHYLAMQTAPELEAAISKSLKALAASALRYRPHEASADAFVDLQRSAVAFVADLARAQLAVSAHKNGDDSVSIAPANIAALDVGALATPQLGRILSQPAGVPELRSAGWVNRADTRANSAELSSAERELERAADARGRVYLETSTQLIAVRDPASSAIRECVERRRMADWSLGRAAIRFGRLHDATEGEPDGWRNLVAFAGDDVSAAIKLAFGGDLTESQVKEMRDIVAHGARPVVITERVDHVRGSREDARRALETFFSLTSAGMGPLEIGEILDVVELAGACVPDLDERLGKISATSAFARREHRSDLDLRREHQDDLNKIAGSLGWVLTTEVTPDALAARAAALTREVQSLGRLIRHPANRVPAPLDQRHRDFQEADRDAIITAKDPDFAALRRSRGALVTAAAEARDAYNARRACHLDQREIDAVHALQKAAVLFTAELWRVKIPVWDGGLDEIAEELDNATGRLDQLKKIAGRLRRIRPNIGVTIGGLSGSVAIDGGKPSPTVPLPNPKPSPLDNPRHVMGALRAVAHALGVDGPQEIESGANARIAELCRERIDAIKISRDNRAAGPGMRAALGLARMAAMSGQDYRSFSAAKSGGLPVTRIPECEGPVSSELDDRRRAMFTQARELSAAHAERFRRSKSDQAAVDRCRDADRELQRRAVRFVASLWRVCSPDLVPSAKVAESIERSGFSTRELRDLIGTGGIAREVGKIAAALSPDVASELEAIARGIS